MVARLVRLWLFLLIAAPGTFAAGPGPGNARAAAIAQDSPLVQSAMQALRTQAGHIQNTTVREQTTAALLNPKTCVMSRAGLSGEQKTAMLQRLRAEGLLDAGPEDAAMTGVFPPVLDESTPCPHLPQPFAAAPGSSFGGHHSYPGGLALHESFNSVNGSNLANAYRRVYGLDAAAIQQDLVLTPPLWHDWAKVIVFQWNADGSEFLELDFGGNGRTDNYGREGNSRTGAHHILGIAEVMKRGFSPELVIAQACAHSAPTLGNEFKVVNWIRAAAILAQVDPVAQHYLLAGPDGKLHLPDLRAEYVIHTLSDADFPLSIPALAESERILAQIAPQFGFRPDDQPAYNIRFRNVVLSNLSAERMFVLSSNGGAKAVIAEVEKIRSKFK